MLFFLMTMPLIVWWEWWNNELLLIKLLNSLENGFFLNFMFSEKYFHCGFGRFLNQETGFGHNF